MKIDFIITLIKTILTNICMLYAFFRIRGNRDTIKENAKSIFLLNLFVSTIYACIYEKVNTYIYPVVTNLICSISYVLLIVVLVRELDYSFPVTILLDICISFSSFFISSVILFYITKIKAISIIRDSSIEYILVEILQLIGIELLFHIKRFKNGFSFIKTKKSHENIKLMDCFVVFMVCIFVVYIINSNHIINRIIFCLITLGMILLVVLVRKAITKQYKSKMKDRAIENLNKQIAEKELEITELKTELDRVLKINHKYNHRISSMERAVSKLKFNEEYSNENGELISLVKQLADEYKSEINMSENVAKTGIMGIDNLIEHMMINANDSNINLTVKTEYDVSEIINKIIKEDKLETLLADHINDAIIAINHSDNNCKEILLDFVKDSDVYEIRFYDTGVEFNTEILAKLGKEQVTAYKDSGGSGIGFVTTFETLKECKGSLIIEEYSLDKSKYTKSIVIRFDNENSYRVCSYRASELEKLECKPDIIEKLEIK